MRSAAANAGKLRIRGGETREVPADSIVDTLTELIRG